MMIFKHSPNENLHEAQGAAQGGVEGEQLTLYKT